MDVRRIEEEVDPDFLSDAHSRTGPAESMTLVKARSNPSEAQHKFISSVISTRRSLEWIVGFPFYLLFADIVDTGVDVSSHLLSCAYVIEVVKQMS
nr:hypothetical protein [Tanacetum cinerariifolium]